MVFTGQIQILTIHCRCEGGQDPPRGQGHWSKTSQSSETFKVFFVGQTEAMVTVMTTFFYSKASHSKVF